MQYVKALLIVVVGLAVWLAGCEVRDPGTPLANIKPTVGFSVAPLDGDTVEHNKHLAWWGNDPDGHVVGYHLFVDGVEIAFTTATDTTIAFYAPLAGEFYPCAIAVVAEDNEGLRSDTARRSFHVVNWPPVVAFDPAGTIPAGATVGKNFRISLAASDTNAFVLYYRISLDDTLSWTAWRRDSVFLFAAPALIADAATFPEGVFGVPNTGLTSGTHTIYAEVKDGGEARSPIISRSFTVVDTFRPVMDTTVVASYGSDLFYPDGSVYYSTRIDVETRLQFSASAAAYRGEINAYRWRFASSGWTEWSREPVVSLMDVPPSDSPYSFYFMARDAAGMLSDSIRYSIRIVQQRLADSIIVVDETRDGTGSPGSPSDAQVDAFYDNLLAGYPFRTIDYATHTPCENCPPYLSPYDVYRAGVILWHADDVADILLDDNLRLLGEFLDRGGRLILSGWDVMAAFSTTDTAQFSGSNFALRRLRLYEAYRNQQRVTVGYSGANGFPGVSVDPGKLPPSWQGRLLKCWSFQPSGECLILGRTVVTDSLTSPFHNRPAVYLYYQSFRVAVFGVPLFFCVDSEARAFIEPLMVWMRQGLQ